MSVFLMLPALNRRCFVCTVTLAGGGGGGAGYCRVVAGLKSHAGKSGRDNAAENGAGEASLSQERPLKMRLKGRRRTRRRREDLLQMFDGLQHRVGLQTGGRRLLAAKQRANRVQLLPEFAPQPVHGFQRKGQTQLFGGRLEGSARQQLDQRLPEPGSGEGMAR